MKRSSNGINNTLYFVLFTLCTVLFFDAAVSAGDLDEIRRQGVLRHLGVPYAHFARRTSGGQIDGLDVELMQRFANHLGVAYKWIETSWATVISDIVGHTVEPAADGGVLIGVPVAVRGDIIANGLTILPWRANVVDYSTPTFPTAVWLIARVDSPLRPITPGGDIQTDIQSVKAMLAGRSVLGVPGTCTDPRLYDLASTGADIRNYTATASPDVLVPEILDGIAEATMLDVPTALMALQKWPGEIKIIGPLSKRQLMAVAVPKTSPKLLAEFNLFFEDLRASGEYYQLVRKYYPSIFLYLGDFFTSK